MATDKKIREVAEAINLARYAGSPLGPVALDKELSPAREYAFRLARAALAVIEDDVPNDTISRVTQEIAAILSEPQNRERIARRIESAEPTTVSD